MIFDFQGMRMLSCSELLFKRYYITRPKAKIFSTAFQIPLEFQFTNFGNIPFNTTNVKIRENCKKL